MGCQLKQPTVRSLGKATTVGQLRMLLEGYSDNTSFSFRNQSLPVLHVVNNLNNTFHTFNDERFRGKKKKLYLNYWHFGELVPKMYGNSLDRQGQ